MSGKLVFTHSPLSILLDKQLNVFILKVSQDCRYLSTTATFGVGSEKFSTTGKTLLDPGYTTVMHWQALAKNETVPIFTEGEEAQIQDVSACIIVVTCGGLIPKFLNTSQYRFPFKRM